MDGVAARDIAGVVERPSDRRRSQRVGVMIIATLRVTGGFFECMVLDVSSGGAKLTMGDHFVLSPGVNVTLIMPPYGTFRAQAIWQRRSVAGIRFLDPPDAVADALGDALPARQAAAS